MYQKCPVCNSEGYIPVKNYSATGGSYQVICPTCNGKRIISTLTGKPPKD